MISIDLREIPIFVLNVKEDQKRKALMTKQLNALGLKHHFISAIECEPKPIGITISHLKTLKQENLKPPFLILEDDCKIFSNKFVYRYDLPQATDALYLGHSDFGLSNEKREGDLRWGAGVRWGERGNIKYEHHDKNYIRIFNMLARHAIVYISEKYVNNAIAANLSALLDFPFNIPGDIMYAEMQPAHLVLSPKEISFYQSGYYEPATRESILSRIQPCEGNEY